MTAGYYEKVFGEEYLPNAILVTLTQKNDDLQNEVGSDYLSMDNVKGITFCSSNIEKFNNMIDNIMIFGGEPLDNSIYEMVKFLSDLKTLNKKIWLFTRYELDNIKTTIICLCDYIKTGAYIEDKLVDNHEMFGIKLASSNQQIYKF
jgi:hypothetical protein